MRRIRYAAITLLAGTALQFSTCGLSQNSTGSANFGGAGFPLAGGAGGGAGGGPAVPGGGQQLVTIPIRGNLQAFLGPP